MKKGLTFCLLAILSLVLTASYAQADDKTGFVDVREVMLNSGAGKKASDDIKKVYEKNKTQIQESETELKKLKDELEKQKAILTEAALKEKESAYQKKFRDYQILVKDANDDLQARDQEISKILIPEILKVIQTIGQKEKYSMIIDVSAIPVAYHAKENELTKRVIDEFNKTYKPKK
jgi:outer membrane protein